MATTPTAHSTNDQACTPGTEHDLATITSAGVYALEVDHNPLVSTEVLEVRMYTKTRSGGTERLLDGYPITIPSNSIGKAWKSDFIAVLYHVRMTIKQVNGSSRTIPWTIYQV